MNAINESRRGERWRRGAVTMLAVAALGLVVAAPQPARAAELGDTWVVATARYECATQSVTVIPTTGEPLDGGNEVWAYASVYDTAAGRWVTEEYWSPVDGITSHVLGGLTSRPFHAVVTYARLVGGEWTYARDAVAVDDELDNAGAFCDLPQW